MDEKSTAPNKVKTTIKEKEIVDETDVKDEELIQETKEQNNILDNSLTREKKKKFNFRNPIFIGILSICIITLFTIGFLTTKDYKLVSSFSNKVYPNSFVLGKDVSNLTKAELHNVLVDMLNKINEQKVQVSVGDKVFDISYKDINTSTDYDALENNILNFGKDKSFFTKLNLIKKPEKKDYDFKLINDENKISEFVSNIATTVDIAPKNSSIAISGSSINIIPGSDGINLNMDELAQNLKDIFSNIPSNEPINISGHVNTTRPNITPEALQGVNQKVSTFSTTVRPGPSGYNASLAINNIDNIILMPGETFSTEKAIGPTTPERGFVSSNIYVNGKVEKGYGGGVCQISSTLYNTILRAGIIPTERLNHIMPVDYVPLGLDATLADGYIDLKFKNPYNYPIVINSYVANGNATVEIWSNNSVLNGVRYEPKTIQKSSLQAETYLYGYDDKSQIVFEKFIDKSTYKPLP